MTNESDPEIEHDVTIEDDFEVPVERIRRTIPKKHFITPRLCSALDKAKVKRMRLKN